MPMHDAQLALITLAAIAGIVLLVVRFRFHGFIALTLAALTVGFGSGLGASEVLSAYKSGFGEVAANVGIVLAFGAMLGSLLAESGVSDRYAEGLLRHVRQERVGWALAGAAFVVGLPLFFETALALVMPMICAVGLALRKRPGANAARDGDAYLIAGLPALAALSALHGLVPPHPGPLVAIDALHADVGRTLLIGVLIALPTIALAGPVFAHYAARFGRADPPFNLSLPAPLVAATPPPRGLAGLMLTCALTPILLLLVKTMAATIHAVGTTRAVCDFIGTPHIALLIGLLLAMVVLARSGRLSLSQIAVATADGCKSIASILLIISAGGGFKAVLIHSGVGDVVAHGAVAFALPPLLLGWLVAVAIRIATGSATVATVTASGILASMVDQLPVDRSLLALAIGAGSLAFSHVNDAGFWMVKEYFGMSMLDTFKTWSVMGTLISVIGLLLAMLLGQFM